ncbi:MAG: methyltransferase domain-containing protein [Acidimicrobiia bacterium]|nr:methyltransferase domain-containing protein [Acidimicrobiia bacterium]
MDTQPWSRFRAGLYSILFRAPKTNRLLVDLAGLSPADRVLDIGCGPGAAVRMAAEVAAESVGVDRADPMIDIARRRSRGLGNVRFEVGSAEALPFPDGAFTIVLAAHSFHHWEDRRAGLAEVARVLADGGRLLILEQYGKKHGLNDAQAATVQADMEELGFGGVKPAKHDKQLLISGDAGP